jgi:hypothetical protein
MAELALRIDLGPVTEARLLEVFSKGAVASGKDAAWAIGVDAKVLSAMDTAGVVRSVPKGQLRGYTERELRRYLIEGSAAECAPTKPQPAPKPKARPARPPNVRYVNFSERARPAKG